MQQNSFMIRLLNNQHETWQGTITWLETNTTQPFRSLLEMITLMESANSGETKEETTRP